MSNQNIGSDNWLHLVTDAIANYVREGGVAVIVESAEGLQITLNEIEWEDERLSGRFQKLRPLLSKDVEVTQ